MGSTIDINNATTKHEPQQLLRAPLQVSGILSEKHRNFPLTPAIGQEFPEASIPELLAGPDSDALLRDLAITGTDHQPFIYPFPLIGLHCPGGNECTVLS